MIQEGEKKSKRQEENTQGGEVQNPVRGQQGGPWILQSWVHWERCLDKVSVMSPKGEVRRTLLQNQGTGAQRKEDSIMSYGGFRADISKEDLGRAWSEYINKMSCWAIRCLFVFMW